MGPLKAKGEKGGARKRSAHPWRENVEALTMAVVVALLFKTFFLEISRIPSGSMQPTLMGDPTTEVFDRVLVDKLSYRFRDPQRFEIVVFEHPLERSRIMVKRLVGMPDEELRILNGDLWTRRGDGEWEILRRPEAVQEAMWRRLDVDEPTRSSWSAVEGAEGWLFEGRDVVARGEGTMGFRADEPAIRDSYLDGYPDVLRGRIPRRNPAWGRNAVGDLRVEGRVRAEEGTRIVSLELSEGPRTYAFLLPGPAAPAGEQGTVRVQAGGEARVERVEGARLPPGRWVRFAAENLDDRLALELDGEELASLEVEPFVGRGSGVAIGLEGSAARFEDLMVLRDIAYLADSSAPLSRPWSVEIPEGSYVMLGDNTQDSADSRDWRAMRYTFEGEDGGERSARGNFREGGENPTRNPRLGLTRFRDAWGEEHWFPSGEARPGLQHAAPLVPRSLLQGRALAVFWPLKPHRGLWRLGWLH